MSKERKYLKMWRNKWLTAEAESIQEMADLLRKAADELEELADKGVVLDKSSDIYYDHALLGTNDADVAMDHGFKRASRFEDLFSAEQAYDRKFIQGYAAYCDEEDEDEEEDFEDDDFEDEDFEEEDDLDAANDDEDEEDEGDDNKIFVWRK